jgi:arginyl-tRNA synthetase
MRRTTIIKTTIKHLNLPSVSIERLKDKTKLIKDKSKKVIMIDLMGYPINKATYHHILAEEDGGKKTVENGAILDKISHQYLDNVIKQNSKKHHKEINKLFMILNKNGFSVEVVCQIQDLLEDFERQFMGLTNNNGKILIKDEYINNRLKVSEIML